nr:zinc finger, CCHC-type [Tanacetum cinerariifolium]
MSGRGRYLSTDMVVSDAPGNAIHCSARSNVAHNFIKLKEGIIYCIKNFVVHPNKEEYRIRKDEAFMLESNGATSAQKYLAKAVGFVRHPFQLVKLDSVELTDNKYMIDVAGYVTNVGRSIQQRTGSRTMDFYLANERCLESRYEGGGALGDTLIEKKTKDVGHYAIILIAMNVKTYNRLSQECWGEALLMTCYLLNRVPNKRNMITPYKLWTKKKPNLNYFKVWGCRAVIRLNDLKLKTLGERGIECIFVGYVEHSKAIRFYVLKPNDSIAINSIIKSKDAIFDENRFSSVPRLSQKSLVIRTKDIGGSVVLKKVTEEVVQQPEPELKKSKRNRYPKDFRPDFQLYLIKGTMKEAINDEMDSIMGNNTWVFADLTLGSKPLDCKLIFKRKLKVDGNVEKFKAMLVIQGFKQKSGIDYFDTYAPVAHISLIRLLIAMILIHSLIIHQMDVKTTFSHGELDEEVLKYLKKTMDYRLMYTGYPSVLEGYTDVSWINNTKDNSSAGKEAEWLKNLLLKIILWSKPITPISIRYDSAATLAKAYNQMYNRKSRHIGVRHSMIHDPVKNKVVSIEFMSWNEVVTPLSDPEIEQLAIKDELGFVIHLESSYINLWFRFPAQSIRSSNVIALNSPYLLVLITGTSQSRQHAFRRDNLIKQRRRINESLKLKHSQVQVGAKKLHVCMPKNRQERRSRNRKSLQQSSILKSLAIWGKDDSITMLVKSMLDGSGLVPLSQGRGDFLEEGTMGNTNIRQCLRKFADVHFTAAMKVLSSSGVAPYCDDTIKDLEANHPYKPPLSMSSNTFSEPLLVADIDSVVGHIKSFPKGTLCGRDGLRAQHILDAICGEGVQQGDPLRPLLFALVLHPLVHKIRDSCKPLLHAVYLDDETIIGDSEEVARVLDIIKVSGPEDVFGCEASWGAISRDADFINEMALRRATNIVDLMSLVS